MTKPHIEETLKAMNRQAYNLYPHVGGAPDAIDKQIKRMMFRVEHLRALVDMWKSTPDFETYQAFVREMKMWERRLESVLTRKLLRNAP